MKLLFITQKIDVHDSVLGFVHQWILRLATTVEHITVICLEKGEHHLPDNVTVLSLGKEENRSRLQYISRFFSYIFHHEYDSVFVHMNQDYVFLGAWFWKLKGKKVALWYNHTFGTPLTNIAMMLVDVVFHTSPFAYTARSRKSVRMPAGIDTKVFHLVDTVARNERGILYIGRLDAVKRVHLLIEAAEILEQKGVHFSVSIYGAASKGSERYEEKLHRMVSDKKLGDRVTFHGSVANSETPVLYSAHSIFVNMTPRGNYDKTVLESMACESLVVASSEAFADFLPAEFRFQENDATDFARALEYALSLQDGDRWVMAGKLHQHVVEQESLALLMDKITKHLGK